MKTAKYIVMKKGQYYVGRGEKKVVWDTDPDFAKRWDSEDDAREIARFVKGYVVFDRESVSITLTRWFQNQPAQVREVLTNYVPRVFYSLRDQEVRK